MRLSNSESCNFLYARMSWTLIRSENSFLPHVICMFRMECSTLRDEYGMWYVEKDVKGYVASNTVRVARGRLF